MGPSHQLQLWLQLELGWRSRTRRPKPTLPPPRRAPRSRQKFEAGAKSEAAAAVANLDSTAEEAQEAAEIAAAMAQDAFPKEEPQESEAPSEEVQV